ncbi:helix-turn-helix transcriptional regulator [Paenibacillus cisolokensis]
MKYRVICGQKIAELRQKRGLTQSMLARRTGIKRAAISHYELGRREPDFETLIILADFFHVSIDFLLGRAEAPTKMAH